MKQVIQNFKTGELYIDDVPVPGISEGMVLVENNYSLISAGTERSTVKVGKANLVGKAKQRPDLVAQVIQNVKKEGLKATMQKVRTKLDSLKALGYSSAGVVKASLDTNGYFKPGDRVACAGLDYATHSGFVSVPQNLIAKVPDNVSMEEAAFTTVGAIALQGIRQAEPKLGENVCVIGLGLIGQITCQLLNANGCNVFGIDFSEVLIDLAKNNGAHNAMNRKDDNLIAAIQAFTNGRGFDSVIITAATQSNDPIILASEILRKKGKVIIVGAVRMDIPRDPYFYRKELDLRMSCSYGPGRYDVNYEENGIDYPYPFVRWTEQRNMEAFLRLISTGVISLKKLITHIFNIEEAKKAYDIVLGKTKEHSVAILLKYENLNNEDEKSYVTVASNPVNEINVGFVGAGSFAQSYLIPNVKSWGASLDTVMTSKGITAKNVAEKYSFNKATSNEQDIFESKDINTVFIATPHNSHAKFTIQALKAGKNVFVEKPLAMNKEELDEISEAFANSNANLMVGFNRRFAPVSVMLKDEFKGIGQPLVMNFRVNAGFIPKDHWTQNPNIGGGRIIGEMCHFIDLMQYFSGAKPVSVYASSINILNDEITRDDNISVIINFDDGSVGNLIYTANGDKSLPKERLEIFGGGKVGVINDFRSGELFKNNKRKKITSQGKGHKEEVYIFLENLKEGKGSPISFESVKLTTLVTFRILDSLATGMLQNV